MMLFSYLKLSLRLLARNPFFTFINIVGLSVGFAVFFILWQYSQSELKSDRQWKDWERIYRFAYLWEYTDPDGTFHSFPNGYHTPGAARNVAESVAEIEDFTRIYNQSNYISEYILDHGTEVEFRVSDEPGRPVFSEEHTAYADPNVFDFFGLPLMAGDPATALQEPSSVVISETIAHKYFGKESPLNKTLIMNDSILFKITGVFENIPHNTHFTFNMLFSSVRLSRQFEVLKPTLDGANCYFKLKNGENADQVIKLISNNKRQYYGEILDVEKGSAGIITPMLQPLQDIAFSSMGHDIHPVKSRFFSIALSVISMVVLMMAWINYVLLTSSFNKKRSIEFLARRTFGAKDKDLLIQFVVESIFINILAILMATTLIQLSKGALQLWFQFHLPSIQNTLPETWFILLIFIMAGIVLCAIIPSMLSYRYFHIEKMSIVGNKMEESLNLKGLSILQFAISFTLIIYVFVVFDQVKFILNKNWGINKNQVIVVELPIIRDNHFEPSLTLLEQKLKLLNQVEGIATSHNVIGDNFIPKISIKGTENAERNTYRTNGGIDENFLPFFNIKLLEGRNFKRDNPVDQQGILVSKRALERMGFSPNDPVIGEEIWIEDISLHNSFTRANIIGIFEDYGVTHQTNFFTKNPSYGIVLTYKYHLQPQMVPKRISIRINTNNIEDVMDKVKSTYSEIFPENAFNWYFMDEHINRHYQSDKTMRNQLFLFTFIAIGIACLGLLGMISNKVVEKTKEIGIRKVLGAELHHIAQILLNTTAKQIIIATVIGIPVAYYLSQQYLEKFSERITLQWWHFALPVAILVMIMFATVASVLWKAARSNPVEALKYE